MKPIDRGCPAKRMRMKSITRRRVHRLAFGMGPIARAAFVEFLPNRATAEEKRRIRPNHQIGTLAEGKILLPRRIVGPHAATGALHRSRIRRARHERGSGQDQSAQSRNPGRRAEGRHPNRKASMAA